MGLTEDAFNEDRCPSECPQSTDLIQSNLDCNAHCFDTCPNLLVAECTHASCPREEALEGLLSSLEREASCTVPLLAYVDLPDIEATDQVPEELLAQAGVLTPEGLTLTGQSIQAMSEGHFQSIALCCAGFSDGGSCVQCDGASRSSGVILFVQGSIPKDEDMCLAAHMSPGEYQEDCDDSGFWFKSLQSSSNSQNVGALLGPLFQLRSEYEACIAYEAQGDLSAGYCWCDDITSSCNYEQYHRGEMECHIVFGAACADTDYYLYDLDIQLTQTQLEDLRLSRGDIAAFIETHVCADDPCEINPNGVIVGEINEDGSVDVFLNITAADELPGEWAEGAVTNAINIGSIMQSIDEAQAQQVTDAPSKGGGSAASTAADSGGGMMMFAAAGAVVLIIVVILIKRRGGGGGAAASRKADRTVVAFENPMYDDPSQGGVGSYGNAGGGEGLYDEPAFNKDGKQNPVYESASEDGGDDGGYLDVAPGAADDE